MSDIKHFDDGALVWVRIGKGKTYAGKVLASSNASTAEHAYEEFRVELEQEITDLAGQKRMYRWVHPHPVQGYKLSKRFNQ